MRYVSTRGRSPILGFDDVLLRGLADDGGLYVPELWPAMARRPDPGGGYAGVAAEVMAPFLSGSVAAREMPSLVHEIYGRFRHPEVAPLVEVGEGRHLLELFWGPTLSFKDYALQVVGALFDRVLSERGERVTVLGATSGDTGSAAIAALAGLESVDVVILFPDGRVSDVQRRQMTTVDAPNVSAVAVAGSFDDCQRLVKGAFGRPSLRDDVGLAAVNSINWARVMAQAAYYGWVWARLGSPFDVAVPTGNFGNVYAAYVARHMGVPIQRMVVGNNANHGLAALVETGRMEVDAVVPTLAPAMDIQVPSNLERYLFEVSGRDGVRVAALMAGMQEAGGLVLDERSHARMRELFRATWIEDHGIEEVIREVHADSGRLLDPHTAVGWAAASRYRRAGVPMVAVATAHPAKFPEAVEAATGMVPALPEDLADLTSRPERMLRVDPSLDALEVLLRAESG